MTSNKIVHKKIWYLAWPMIISNLSVPLLGLIDTAILGHLDDAIFLGAVAVGSSILSFLYWGFGFLRMGTTGMTAQSYGAQNHDQGKLIIGQSIILSLSLGLMIIVVSPWVIRLGLHWMDAPAQTSEYALSYCSIRIFSAPAVLINFAIIGWLIGRQNTRWPLLISLFTNLLNVILDCVFILGLDMKSDGAAFATLIAEFSGCALAIHVVRKEFIRSAGKLPFPRLKIPGDYQKLLMVNRHLFFRTLVLLASFAFFTAQGAKQGEIILAANTLIMNLLLLTSFGLDGFAHAAESLVGDAYGKRDKQLFYSTCKHCGQWCVGTAISFTALFVFGGDMIMDILTSIEEVKQHAVQYLPWLYALPLLAVWSYLLDGIFIGTTQTRAMRNSMMLSALFVYLPCWYFTQHWGNHGLWFAFIAFNLARSITLGWYFKFYCSPWAWWPEQTDD